MKTMKKTAIFTIELIFVLYLGIIFIVGLTGGFSITFGPLILRIHKLKNPIIILLGVLLLRKLLVGNFLNDFICLGLIRRLGSNRQLLSDRLLIILVVLLAVMGVVTLTNPLQRGLTGYYYDNGEWAGSPILMTKDSALNFNRINRIVPDITTRFSIEWTGEIFIPASGTYHFSTISRDGSELYIDKQLIVDNGGAHDVQKRSGVIFLKKGFYPMKIRYQFLEGPEGAVFKVYWKRPGRKNKRLSRSLSLYRKTDEYDFFIWQIFRDCVCCVQNPFFCVGRKCCFNWDQQVLSSPSTFKTCVHFGIHFSDCIYQSFFLE